MTASRFLATTSYHTSDGVRISKTASEQLNELKAISAYIDSRLENIEHFLNDLVNPPNEIEMDDLDPDDESVDARLVSPFLDLDDDFDDDKLESTGVNLVAIVRDVCVFIGSFTYVTDFVVLEDIGEFILRDMAEVMMDKPFREVTKLEYDCAKGLMSFTRIFDTYTFQIPRIIPRFKNWGYASWSRILPIHVLSNKDLINRFKYPHEKNKLMYKNCLNLGPEYQVDESMKEWLICRHVSLQGVM
ncbi:hypothetical protein Tco_0519259 [Tanacetum coccineum]